MVWNGFWEDFIRTYSTDEYVHLVHWSSKVSKETIKLIDSIAQEAPYLCISKPVKRLQQEYSFTIKLRIEKKMAMKREFLHAFKYKSGSL